MKHTYIIISLSAYIHINMKMLTRAIPIRLPVPLGFRAYIRFPQIHNVYNDMGMPIAELQSPILWQKCGEELPSSLWGQISYVVKENVEIPIISVRSFVIDVESNDFLRPDIIEGIKSLVGNCVDNILCVLSINYPDYLTVFSNINKYYFISSCSANYDQPKGNRMVEIGGVCNIVRPKLCLSPSILFPLIRQCNQKLTIQYQFLTEIKKYYKIGDYRSCVLHACTIFETTLQRKLSLYLSENDVPCNISKFVNDKIMGFNSYEKLYCAGFPQCPDPRVKKTTEIRNKVIHEGRIVTKQEALDAFDAAYNFLHFYNWGIFEPKEV